MPSCYCDGPHRFSSASGALLSPLHGDIPDRGGGCLRGSFEWAVHIGWHLATKRRRWTHRLRWQLTNGALVARRKVAQVGLDQGQAAANLLKVGPVPGAGECAPGVGHKPAVCSRNLS